MDLNPVSPNTHFDFDLQVWRPSPTETECYSLVDNYAVESILPPQLLTDHVARVTPLPQNQLHFQPGDVLGFYVESSGTLSDHDNGVVLLNDNHHTSELVWHASITDRSSLSGSCPYPVGTSGVLTLSTHAAPVISISATTYSCPQSSIKLLFHTPISAIHSPVSGGLPCETLTIVFGDTSTTSDTATKTNSRDIIIAGCVVAAVVLCCISLLLIVIIAVVRKCQIIEKSPSWVDTCTTVSSTSNGELSSLSEIRHNKLEILFLCTEQCCGIVATRSIGCYNKL